MNEKVGVNVMEMSNKKKEIGISNFNSTKKVCLGNSCHNKLELRLSHGVGDGKNRK
jgi:hypothetical protein